MIDIDSILLKGH